MKTYEYIVHPGTTKAFNFFFDAASRVEADTFLKQRTKRGAKSEFVAARKTTTLQSIPQHPTRELSTRLNFNKEITSSKNWTFVYECPECMHQWTRKSNSSTEFQMKCPNKKFKHAAPVGYQHLHKFNTGGKNISYVQALYKHVQLPEFDMDGTHFMEQGSWERPIQHRSAS